MPVLAQLSHQVKWEPFVLSDINLSSFLAWAGKTETSELVAVLSLVNLGIHRGCGESPSVQARSKEGLNFPIPQISCDREECDRCTTPEVPVDTTFSGLHLAGHHVWRCSGGEAWHATQTKPRTIV